jgi:hypothetical protein
LGGLGGAGGSLGCGGGYGVHAVEPTPSFAGVTRSTLTEPCFINSFINDETFHEIAALRPLWKDSQKSSDREAPEILRSILSAGCLPRP